MNRTSTVSRAAGTAALRVGIYTRISHDPEETRLGVQRQEADCRALAKRRRWHVISVYEDDDLSAYNAKARPDYQRLLEDIRAGAVQAVVAWHPDRLHRSPRDLETFIEVVEAAGCAVETVQAGNLDLSTPTGRMQARIVGSMARYESEHKSARLKAKHEELAKAGKDAGGGRPFGYEADRRTIRPQEATLIREAAARVLAGEALRRVCVDWNSRGFKSVTGRNWSVHVLKRMLVSARISGRRERGTVKGKRHLIGDIITKAVWPGIITVHQSDRLRAVLGNPDRRKNGQPTKYLLTGGLAVCGLCGAALVARPKQAARKGMPSVPSLVCAAGPGFHGCGKIRIGSDPLAALVSEAVLQAVDGGALARALRATGEDRAAVTQLAKVEQKLADLADDWASDRLTRGEWAKARETLVARQAALQRRVEASRRHVGLDGLPDPLRAAWPALPLYRQRAVVAALVEAVVIGSGVKGLNRFDDRRVALKWKA